MQVAVIGAGWAGLAAAIAAAQAGHTVSVFETARMLGGRARALAPAEGADTKAPFRMDNGQHILIGAYSECLRLMRLVGIDPDAALLRTPLALVFPDGNGLRFPDAAPPWDAIRGIAGARGWPLADRLALLRRAVRWRISGFRCQPRTTVEQLCQGLPERLLREFIDPLCVSALNTPIGAASGAVFLRVLRDSLFSGRGGSHLLLPRRDLSALWPEAAAAWLQTHGHAVHAGRRIQSLEIATGSRGQAWRMDGMQFDAVVVATTSTEAARLVAAAADTAPPRPAAALRTWAATAAALRFTAIATVYAKAAGALPPALAGNAPMLALRSGPEAPAQFVFDRGHLGGEPGLLAFVVSAFEGERAVLEQAVLRQAREQLGLEGLQVLRTIVEKRATFACLPALDRPPQHIMAGLVACGDYVAGPYPATLEGAVLSGTAAGRSL
ncbi:hydroxysqualene dehydroxylase HpnE [Paracidovorax citrulli]|uniref:Amine oxidase n=2 Tax=Paracidovorax citrulli TaxID=80869 RepID=A1TM58_PARC0|nr:hydroxysqualene dehydroxylase HpnE [Paracidovorax citrulli]ABM32046.1 amine oxidase [Paracidovorax citrulli AAC00-1]ATG94922.1 desaturase [Paracidovorax citrulli]MVT30281.1 NAD(P)-binding protein [Paracidovorax citrulli]PVY66235.1 squalene-associated FAD-dependent desaturase [Paracidovorax citrulli]REG69592.1 squalene-associated FAD-dependent desaturase [Paracidovorax citrulli]